MSSNFAFLAGTWPRFQLEATRTEQAARTDPVGCCFFARRALETVVGWMYRADSTLREPYRDDLSARLAEPTFQHLVPQAVRTKMDLIRRLGNRAAHPGNRGPTPDDALTATRELFHVMYWVATTYAPEPAQRPPPGLAFDPQLLPPPDRAVIRRSAQQIAALEAERRAQDEAIAEVERRNADLDAEIARLREEVARARAANTERPDTHDYDEAQTRDRFIDELLRESGWDLSGPDDTEYRVDRLPNGGRGRIDYVLWGEDGLPLALVEAKRTRRDPRQGRVQAAQYADALESRFGRRPLVYYTNGYEHWFWDDQAYPPRRVEGFHTRDELEAIIGRRTRARPLPAEPINDRIAGRAYQQRAIRRVAETFDTDRQRRVLLVMATGAGKTRTVIALADLLQRCGWIRRVLFLADRTALVRQAANAFRTHLPDSPLVNLLDDRAGTGRVYLSTYPTILNLINRLDGANRRPFGPGFFDLVVIDEAHRSVYQKYRAIFSYLDALLVGLTATPKDQVDHNTYQLFGLEDGVPTDAYPLEEAIADGYLVPPRGVSVPLQIPQRGLRYHDLTAEEQERWDELEWDEDGAVPAEVDAGAVNSWLFNRDTVDKVIAHLMTNGHRVAAGDRLGKTVIFARNNAHALFIAERFDQIYPQFRGTFAEVITYSVERAETLIDRFSAPDSAPHIAISVDMLDTGIDVPEIVNLVFFKLVHSRTKFAQMIGRGTRLRPDLFGPGGDKTDFFVFDFCRNFEFFGHHPLGVEGNLVRSLSERIFRSGVQVLSELDQLHDVRDGIRADVAFPATDAQVRTELADSLHARVAGMNTENVIVRPRRREVELLADRTAWASTDPTTVEAMESVASLPSVALDPDEGAKRFDLLVLRLQLALLTADPLFDMHRERTQELATRLLELTSIPAVGEQAAFLDEIASDDWWVDVTVPMLEQARRRIRGLVRLIPADRRRLVYSDFADTVGPGAEIAFPGLSVALDYERFKAKVRDFLAQHRDHVAIQRLHRNQPLTATDLAELERILIESGIGTSEHLHRARVENDGFGLFVRSLVGLDRAAAVEAVNSFVAGRNLTADQIEFVELVIRQLTQTGVMEPRALYEPPFTDLVPTGPEQLFEHHDLDRLVAVLRDVRATAIA